MTGVSIRDMQDNTGEYGGVSLTSQVYLQTGKPFYRFECGADRELRESRYESAVWVIETSPENAAEKMEGFLFDSQGYRVATQFDRMLE